MTFFEKFFRMESVRKRHSDAPLASERVAYLSHLVETGHSRSGVNQAAVQLIHINRVLGLSDGLRPITPAELQSASEAWYAYKGPLVCQNRRAGPYSAELFRRIARGWLRFHRCLVVPEKSRSSEKPFREFAHDLRFRFGLAHSTIDTRLMHVSFFLIWLNQRRIHLRYTTIQHVERYLDEKRRRRWSLDTAILAANSLRQFLRFAEERGLVREGIYNAVPRFPRPKHHFVKKGPKWSAVDRMLSSLEGQGFLKARQRAITLLIARYGLRSSEIVNPKMGEASLVSRVITVRRGKNMTAQRFPLTRQIVSALKRYLAVRPLSTSPALFVSALPPYAQVSRTTIHGTIRTLFLKNRITSRSKGPHALRHACADRLMQQGASVYEIADFLGHKEVASVRAYARYDTETLRPVADFSLRGLT